jgi:hypothetical protein
MDRCTGALFLSVKTDSAGPLIECCITGCCYQDLPGSWRRETVVAARQDKVENIDLPIGIDVTAAGHSAGNRCTAKRAADAGQVAEVDQAVIVGIASLETRLWRGKCFQGMQQMAGPVSQIKSVPGLQLVV